MTQVITWRDVWEEFQVKGKDIIELVEVYELEQQPVNKESDCKLVPIGIDKEADSSDQIIRTPFPNPSQLIINEAHKEYFDNLSTNRLSGRINSLEKRVEAFHTALEKSSDESYLKATTVKRRPVLPIGDLIQVFPAASKQARAEYLTNIKLKECENLIEELTEKLLGSKSIDQTPPISIAAELETISHELLHYCDENKLISKAKALSNLLDAQEESRRIKLVTSGSAFSGGSSVGSLSRLEQRSKDARIESLFGQMEKFQSLMANLKDVDMDFNLVGGCAELRSSLSEVTNRITGTDQLLSSTLKQLDQISATITDQMTGILQLTAKGY